MTYKHLILFVSIQSALLAYIDTDIDGVDDSLDLCKDTPFSDIVDNNGCSIKSLKSYHNLGIVTGINYSQIDYNTNDTTDTISTSLEINYSYKHFSLQTATSYFKSDSNTYSNKGLSDSYITSSYRVFENNLVKVTLGIGAILPTYKSDFNNNNTDFMTSTSINYNFKDISLFSTYKYTFINDDDVISDSIILNYQNTNLYSLGIGWFLTNDFYSSLSYNHSQSIYADIENIQSISAYSFYYLNKNLYTIFGYSYGLSDSTSNHASSIKLGYSFNN